MKFENIKDNMNLLSLYDNNEEYIRLIKGYEIKIETTKVYLEKEKFIQEEIERIKTLFLKPIEIIIIGQQDNVGTNFTKYQRYAYDILMMGQGKNFTLKELIKNEITNISRLYSSKNVPFDESNFNKDAILEQLSRGVGLVKYEKFLNDELKKCRNDKEKLAKNNLQEYKEIFAKRADEAEFFLNILLKKGILKFGKEIIKDHFIKWFSQNKEIDLQIEDGDFVLEDGDFKMVPKFNREDIIPFIKWFENEEAEFVKYLELNGVNTVEELRKLGEAPKQIVILFIASNPTDQEHLRLDREARAISEMMKKGKYRELIKFQTCWAVQPIDILQAINEHEPTIIHFSGHGSDNSKIVFQNDNGQSKFVTIEAILQTIINSSQNLRLIFFNTCYSKNQAIAIAEYLEAAIGMNNSIGDEAAIIFSSQFYSSISFGFSVKKSFEQAKALLMLENTKEENTPELFINSKINLGEIILVNPN